MPLSIGIDGGGTKTLGVLMDGTGRILAEASSGGTNPHSNPRAVVSGSLKAIVDELLREASVAADKLDAICLGMAGVDRPADKEFVEGIVREVVPAATKLVIVNDAVVAMVAVLGRLHGLLVIAGTGSICYGFNGNRGVEARCGGWGHLLADEGAGYQIGLAALRAAMHAFDGRGPETALTKKLLRTLELKVPTDLIGWTYLSGTGKAEIAALSRLVHEADGEGDAVAGAILEEQARLLAEIVAPVYRKLFDGTERAPLALWGGNILNAKRYQARFCRLIEATGLPLDITMKDARAVEGAARHGLNALG